MKLLVDNLKIKASYKDGNFYNRDGQKIKENEITEIFLSLSEFKEFFKNQPEKKTSKKKIKDE